MSTTLKTQKSSFGNITLTQFFGGKEMGLCVQLTQDYKYIQLSKSELKALAKWIMINCFK